MAERTAAELAAVSSVIDSVMIERAAAIRDLARRAKAGVDVEHRVTALQIKAEIRLAELVREGRARDEIIGASGGRPKLP